MQMVSVSSAAALGCCAARGWSRIVRVSDVLPRRAGVLCARVSVVSSSRCVVCALVRCFTTLMLCLFAFGTAESAAPGRGATVSTRTICDVTAVLFTRNPHFLIVE